MYLNVETSLLFAPPIKSSGYVPGLMWLKQVPTWNKNALWPYSLVEQTLGFRRGDLFR